MGVVVFTHLPVFLELALAVKEMLGVSILIDEVVRVKETLSAHKFFSKYCS